jgi:hypothetical protein
MLSPVDRDSSFRAMIIPAHVSGNCQPRRGNTPYRYRRKGNVLQIVQLIMVASSRSCLRGQKSALLLEIVFFRENIAIEKQT